MLSDQQTSYTGLYGDSAINLVRNLIHITPIEEKGKFYNWHIKPHLHSGLFQLFVIEQGSAEILFADKIHKIEGPVYFTVPKNVSHGFNFQSDLKGWLISLDDTSLEVMLKLDADIIFAIDEIQIVKILLDEPLIADAYTTMHKCITEFNSDLPAKNLALQYLVGMLLLRLYRIPHDYKLSIRSGENPDKIHFRKFMQLLKQSNSPHKGLDEYAALLGIKTGHLNRVCKNVNGRSPKDTIIEYFIHEAKNALINPDLSISEISYGLNFEDPGYFSRLFKKKTGQTPKQFRQSVVGTSSENQI